MEAEFRKAGLPSNPSLRPQDTTYDEPYQKYDTMPPPPPPGPPGVAEPPGETAEVRLAWRLPSMIDMLRRLRGIKHCVAR